MKGIYLIIITFAIIISLTTQQSFQEIQNESIEENREFPSRVLKFLEHENKKEINVKVIEVAALGTLVKGFMKFTEVWKKAVDVFYNKSTTEIMERLKGQGFEKFAQDAQVQITNGVKEEHFDKFTESLLSRIKVPEGREADIQSALETSRFADRQMWSAFNTLFNVDDGGNVKFASVIVNRWEKDGKDVYDFVYSDLKSTFKLAPDVTVVNKKLILLGGLWSDNEIIYQKHPKSLTSDDIEAVMSFFNVVAFKTFANHFGIKLEFPELK